MYSFKEKKRHFVDLKNATAAESDLLLLMSKVKQVSPSWRRQPRRYADDILYRLLDVATREEIRINRRERMKVQDVMSSAGDESKVPVDNLVPTECSEIDGHDELSKKADDDDVQKRISEAEAARQEAEERAEEAETAMEEAEGRAEEAETALEEAEERAEEAEAALEEEKKKEPKSVKSTAKGSKSKRTKSIR